MYDISVIVPVYRVEQFIGRFLTSIWDQDYKATVEWIIVNDCTPDASMSAVRQIGSHYQKVREHLRIIDHLENKGAAAARQTGLNAATGRYILFLDSDDFCDPGIFDDLFSCAEKQQADIVLCDFYYEYEHRSIRVSQRPLSLDPDSCILQLLTGTLHGASWNKLVRRDLYVAHNIRYIEGLNIWEDLYANIRLFSYAEKIAYLHKAFVHYVQYNAGSLTSNGCNSRKKIRQTVRVATMIEQFLRPRWRDSCSSSQYEKAMNVCKFHAKMPLILSFSRKDNLLWKRVFPESNSCLWQDPYTDTPHKIAFMFARYGLFWMKDLMIWSGRIYNKYKQKLQ